uniref:PR domain zinc finger protein 2-like n=1 Tax=Astyanax mexicanus TaxID=7994 RepID=A0A3B1JMU4_ASTMX
MWDPNNAVKAEEQSVSSGKQQQQAIILQSPTENQKPSLSGETPPLGVSGQKQQKAESETEGRADEVMENSVEDQNIFQVQRTSCPPVETMSLQIRDIPNSNASCINTGETEESGMHQQDSGFSCQHCQKQFTTKQGLEQHLHASKSCNTQTFRCRYCRKSFNTQFGRRRHERRHDNSNRRMGTLIVSASSQVEGQTQVMVSSEEGEQRVVASQTITESLVPDFDGKGDSDESGERKAKASLACRYCKKAFGTHTNLRRHERRIHERHLLPRRLCRKVANCQDLPGQQPGEDAEAFTIGSKQREQEEEFMVDISSNISENLSFYIDGKIISTSAVTNCEMMEVNSGAAAAVIGLDALIISPAQITQALKIDTNDYSTTSDLCGQPSGRRRTSTPPLLPQIKTELESESILTTSSSGPTVIGTVLPQPLETIVLQKEKTIYLSPKLKQLLQNQDSSKSFALIGDGQKLCPPLPLTLVSAGTSRFKRRTSSPTSSPQHSRESGIKSTLLIQEQSSPPNKVQKTNSPNTSPAISLCKNYEMENLNIDTTGTTAIPQVLPLDCSTSGTGGRSCNQQPLDLSNAVGKRNSEVLADECVLDLSTGRKSTEADLTGSSASQTTIRRIKPNSSMLEKVLLSQYAATAVDVPPGCAAGDAATLHAPVVADLAVMAVSEPISANPGPERVVFELALPSPSTINASPHPLNAAVLQTTPPSHILSAPSSSTAVPTEILPTVPSVISIPNQELFPLCSSAQSFIPIVPTTTVEVPTDNPLPAFNVSLPDWLNSAPGSVTHALIPTTAPLSLQSPQFLTDPSVCDLAQRTLVVDSVLSPEAQIFSPSLSVNQSNITSLSFPPNVVVIEYTVALESTDAPAILQANAVHSLSDCNPPDQAKSGEILDSPQPQATAQTEQLAPELQQPGTHPDPIPQDLALGLHSSTNGGSSLASLENPATTVEPSPSKPNFTGNVQESQLEPVDPSNCSVNPTTETTDGSTMDDSVSEEASNLLPLCKHFMCNACDETFPSMKGLSRHIGEHSKTWPYKCEFCVQLFESDTGLLEHRSSYHGIGKIYVCRICSKEFAFLCNLEQHQRDVHPGQECSHTEVENGKLRPENHNSPIKMDTETSVYPVYPTKQDLEKTYKCDQTPKPAVKEEENGNDSDHTTEELYTTIKIMASEGVKPKGTDVRLGINQHYPSFKPPPFPYHNRTPATTTTATATNFTTHNIPQTFSTAIRCTKCGKSFDNMPELHKHILACANASDKKRYTPKKNPIPLKQFAKTQNGVLSPARGVNSRQNVSQKIGHKVKLNMHSKKKSMWVQRSRHHVGRKGLSEELDLYACPHCGKEFTYQASLKKHIVISCPMKPVCNKKSKKRKGSVTPAQENNGSIRTRVAEVIMKQRRSNQGQKIFKKAQISESASADNANLAIKAQDGKRKIIVHNFRPKRSDVLSATSAVHLSKKSKHVLMEGIQSTPQTLQKSSTLQGKSHQQPPTHRVHGGIGREIKQREVNVKLHPRTEEQFSGQRGKERTERPITRSLQQVNTTVNTVANANNRKANTITLARHPVQTDSRNISAYSEVIDSKK